MKIRRSMLYVPGISEKMIRKSLELKADAIIFDLEDAVALDQKFNAREILKNLLNELSFGEKEVVVRVNGLQSGLTEEDLIWTLSDKIDAVLLPKVLSEDDVKNFEGMVEKISREKGLKKEIRIHLMIETPSSVLRIREICEASEKLSALLLGSADLSKEMRCKNKKEILQPLISLVIAGGRTENLDVIDAPFFNIKDMDGLERDCISAKEMGFDGKQVIHPSQIEIVNRIFSPSEEEILWAEKVISQYEAAMKKGIGVISIDGEMIERLHYEQALRIKNLAERR